MQVSSLSPRISCEESGEKVRKKKERQKIMQLSSLEEGPYKRRPSWEGEFGWNNQLRNRKKTNFCVGERERRRSPRFIEKKKNLGERGGGGERYVTTSRN